LQKKQRRLVKDSLEFLFKTSNAAKGETEKIGKERESKSLYFLSYPSPNLEEEETGEDR